MKFDRSKIERIMVEKDLSYKSLKPNFPSVGQISRFYKQDRVTPRTVRLLADALGVNYKEIIADE